MKPENQDTLLHSIQKSSSAKYFHESRITNPGSLFNMFGFFATSYIQKTTIELNWEYNRLKINITRTSPKLKEPQIWDLSIPNSVIEPEFRNTTPLEDGKIGVNLQWYTGTSTSLGDGGDLAGLVIFSILMLPFTLLESFFAHTYHLSLRFDSDYKLCDLRLTEILSNNRTQDLIDVKGIVSSTELIQQRIQAVQEEKANLNNRLNDFSKW